MNEELSKAIEDWQKADGEKRAILVISTEVIDKTEENTTCNTAVAVIGRGKLLAEAVKSVKGQGGAVADLFKKADLLLLMEKLSEQ